MTPDNEKREWTTVQLPPSDDRTVEVMDGNGTTRDAYACYYPFDLVGGKIIQLDKPTHDGTWLIDETIPFTKNEIGVFDTPVVWRDKIKQEGGE